MSDRTRLSRLITLALASCAVTWAFAGGAMARPDVGTVTASAGAPAYKAVAGDVNKAPSASTAPAYQPAIGDSLKTPDPVQVDHTLASLGRGTRANPGAPVVTSNDDTGTVALVTAIIAMLIAVAAVTFTFTRPRPVLRA
jgi:hypothetical protein